MKPLLGILAFIVMTNVGIIAVTHWLMPQGAGWALFGGWLLNLVVIAVSAGIASSAGASSSAMFVPFILLAVYSLVYGIIGGHIPRAFRLRESPVMTVADAGKQVYDVYRFSDAHVETKHLEHLTVPGRGRLYYYAAPVVPAGWKPGDPVPAWVVHSSKQPGYPADWDKEFRGGYDPGFDDRYRELMEGASRNKATPTSPNAPVLMGAEDPRSGFMSTAWWELGGLILIDLVAIGMAIFAALRPEPPPS